MPERVTETSGRTVDEAIERALSRLGLRHDQVDVDVITEGKAGFLGFGSEDAIVRVTAKESVATTGGQRPRGGRRGAAPEREPRRESPGARP
ncbi:MAG: Jag N-terminal domain-containing protein, partial [Dehalococcoidia bacterium]